MSTRDFLMSVDCKTALGAIEESPFWLAEQHAVSLAATLACRLDDGSIWILGHGSLIWNPALNYHESRTGTPPNWHRASCLRLTAECGSTCQPGHMLVLGEGGRTTGVAYRLPDDALEEELVLLWKRGMITGCYLLTWCKLELDDRRIADVLVFIMNSRHPLFRPDTNAQVIASLITRANGPLGTSVQYLFSFEQALSKPGMHDAGLDDLVASVRALLGESLTPGLVWARRKGNTRHGRASDC